MTQKINREKNDLFFQEECRNACQSIINHCRFDENEIHLTQSDLIIQVNRRYECSQFEQRIKSFQSVELTCGDRGEDPIRNMWFYTKVCPNKATKISKEQVDLNDKNIDNDYFIRFQHFYLKYFVNMIFVFTVKIVIQQFAQLFVVVLKNFVQQEDMQYLRYFVKIECSFLICVYVTLFLLNSLVIPFF